MKLCRYGPRGSEKPGVVDAQGRLRDLSAHIGDLTPDTVRLSQLARLKALDISALPLVADTPRYAVDRHPGRRGMRARPAWRR